MDDLIVTSLILLSNKKEQTIDMCFNTDNLKINMLSGRSQTKYIDSLYTML